MKRANPSVGFLLLTALTLPFPVLAEPTIVQILHTNDLHGSIHTAGAPEPGSTEKGGWAQIKTVMDRLTNLALQEGIETIRLDAGDFSEGTLDYFPDRGRHVFRPFQAFGFHAATPGNHDWMMGATDLNATFGSLPFTGTRLVGSNFSFSWRMNHLRNQIKPTTVIPVACNPVCKKIGIVGVTTREAFYRWIPRVNSRRNDMRITKPHQAVRNEIPALRSEADAVIVLSHLGLKEDKKLVRSVSGMDLVIGGHSHSLLQTPTFETTSQGESVPIVQVGNNGSSIGKIRIEINPGFRPKLLSYEVVPIEHSEARDPVIEALAQTSLRATRELFLPKDIDAPILTQPTNNTAPRPVTAEVRLVSGNDGPTAFNKFLVDAIRTESGSEIAFDIGAFQGNTPQTAGPVTPRKLMELYPRKFELSQNEGWYIYHSRIPGWVLKLGIQYGVKYGFYFAIGGLSFSVRQLSPRELERQQNREIRRNQYPSRTAYRATEIRINGEKIRNLHRYSTTTSEGIIRGAFGITPLTKILFQRAYRTPYTLWTAMENTAAKIGSIRRIRLNEHFNGREFSPQFQEQFQDRRKRNQQYEQFEVASQSGNPLPLPWIIQPGPLDDMEDTNLTERLFHQFLNEVMDRTANENFEDLEI